MRVFVTGTAGFIGFHLAQLLLREGHLVHGFDGMTDYYDVSLKERRHAILRQNAHFQATEARLEDREALARAVAACDPDVIVHLAAQAGVRYSIDNPRAYLETNIAGSFNLMEAALVAGADHLLMASTSSVYGASTAMPYAETQKVDTQMSFYAATKKANEAMGHAWAHIHGLPTTMFRFFTVYGPWGRPDMALFKFTAAILEGRPIDVYNHGAMWRDFTYIDDLVRAIRLLIDVVPPRPDQRAGGAAADAPSAAGTVPASGGAPDTRRASGGASDTRRASGATPAASVPALSSLSSLSSPAAAPGDPSAAPVPDTSKYAPVPDAFAFAPVPGDSLSPVAPFRVVNIGNSGKVRLEDFIDAIEAATGRRAIRNYMDMQPGDVPATWADASLLRALTGYAPQTDIREGVQHFVDWFRDYYRK